MSMGCRHGCCAFQLQLAPNGVSPSERGGVGQESDAGSIREVIGDMRNDVTNVGGK